MTANRHRVRLARMGRHIRSQAVGYLALVVALTMTPIPTYAGHLFPVETSDLRNGAVTRPKIGSGAVTRPKIGSGAVTRPKIRSGAVTTPKIRDGAVTTPKLQNRSVTGVKLADDAITHDTGLNCGVASCSTKIGVGAIGSREIAFNALQAFNLAEGAVTRSRLRHPYLWARVDADSTGATLLQRLGATSAFRLARGLFGVRFDRPVDTCAWNATLNQFEETRGDQDPAGPVVTVEVLRDPRNDTLRILTLEHTGFPVDPAENVGFSLLVHCGF